MKQVRIAACVLALALSACAGDPGVRETACQILRVVRPICETAIAAEGLCGGGNPE